MLVHRPRVRATGMAHAQEADARAACPAGTSTSTGRSVRGDVTPCQAQAWWPVTTASGPASSNAATSFCEVVSGRDAVDTTVGSTRDQVRPSRHRSASAVTAPP